MARKWIVLAIALALGLPAAALAGEMTSATVPWFTPVVGAPQTAALSDRTFVARSVIPTQRTVAHVPQATPPLTPPETRAATRGNTHAAFPERAKVATIVNDVVTKFLLTLRQGPPSAVYHGAMRYVTTDVDKNLIVQDAKKHAD